MIPLQCIMVITIGRKYDRNIDFETAKALIVTIAGGFLGRQICSTLIKLIPAVGGMISAPFSYGWTFGIGEMAILYFETQGKIKPEDLREGFKKVRENAEKRYSEEITDVDEVLEKIRSYMPEEEYLNLREKISKDCDR